MDRPSTGWLGSTRRQSPCEIRRMTRMENISTPSPVISSTLWRCARTKQPTNWLCPPYSPKYHELSKFPALPSLPFYCSLRCLSYHGCWIVQRCVHRWTGIYSRTSGSGCSKLASRLSPTSAVSSQQSRRTNPKSPFPPITNC